MKTYLSEGENITITAPSDVVSGAGVKVGGLFGVASNDAVAGTDLVIKRRGVFELGKTAAESWALGALIYWDDAAKECTTTDTANTLIGAAVAVAANPSPLGKVLLDGVVR